MDVIFFKKINFKYFVLLALSLIIITLFSPLKYMGISVILLAITWIFSTSLSTKIQHFKQNKYQYLFLVLYLSYLIGLVNTENMNYGGKLLETMLTIVIFPLILCSTEKIEKQLLNKFLDLYVIISICISILTLFLGYRNYIINHDIEELFYHKLAKNVDFSAIYLSLYIAFGYFIVFTNWLPKFFIHKIYFKILTLFTLCFLLIFLILLSSKMIIIITILSSIILSVIQLLNNKLSKKYMLIMSVLIIFILTLIANLKITRERFENLKFEKFNYTDVDVNGITGRLAMWISAKDVIKNNFWLGVGTGDIDDELIAEYHKKDFRVGYFWKYNAHNQYIQTFLGQGFIGFIILLCLFLIPLIQGIKEKNYLYLSFCFLFFGLCFTETTLTNLKGVSFFAFVNSLLIFHSFNNKPKSN